MKTHGADRSLLQAWLEFNWRIYWRNALYAKDGASWEIPLQLLTVVISTVFLMATFKAYFTIAGVCGMILLAIQVVGVRLILRERT